MKSYWLVFFILLISLSCKKEDSGIPVDDKSLIDLEQLPASESVPEDL